VGFLMAVLATIAVLLRFEARRIRKAIKTDDYIIIVSLLCLIGQCACNIVGAIAGRLGTHASIDSTASKQTQMSQQLIVGKVIFITNLLAILGPGCTRASIFFLYKRVFIGQIFQVSSWIFIGLNVMWIISFLFSNIFACVPTSGIWSFSLSGKCVDVDRLFHSLVVSDVILDSLALVVPIYPVWHLQMPIQQKLTVSGIFLLGGFVVISGILRAIAQFNALKPNPDSTWSGAPAFYWATIETGVGIISACLPTMRPLFDRSGPESIIRVASRKLRSAVSGTALASNSKLRERRPSEGSEAIPLSTRL